MINISKSPQLCKTFIRQGHHNLTNFILISSFLFVNTFIFDKKKKKQVLGRLSFGIPQNTQANRKKIRSNSIHPIVKHLT